MAGDEQAADPARGAARRGAVIAGMLALTALAAWKTQRIVAEHERARLDVETRRINLALQDSRSDIPARCPHDNCVTARIRLFALELRSARPNAPQSELDALRYLVHFVGDLHQPLHVRRPEDRGGTLVSTTLFGMQTDLHSVWDAGLIDSRRLSYSEYSEWLVGIMAPGDVIACGTSLGVLPMRPGTVVEIVIDGIGTLRNRYEALASQDKATE